jgi:hypothetical protein
MVEYGFWDWTKITVGFIGLLSIIVNLAVMIHILYDLKRNNKGTENEIIQK